MMYLLMMLGVLGLVLVLLPVLSPPRITPADTRRTELTEERDLLLASLAELQASGADERTLTREKVRLAQLLHELDALPPAPLPGELRPAFPAAAGLVLGVTLLLAVGSLTFFPQWRSVGLSPAERVQLANAAELPRLRAQAESQKTAEAYAAWGNAAWDARQYANAAQAYAEVLRSNRTDARALRRVGYFLLGDEKMAQNGLSFIVRSLELDPQNPEGHLLYGYGLGLFGQYQAGLNELQKYQQLAPDAHDADDADDLIVQYQAQLGGKVDGALVFSQNCAGCHGQKGEGGTGPRLTGSPALKNAAALRQIVLHGATGMPAFPQLEGKQLDALVKTLQGWK